MEEPDGTLVRIELKTTKDKFSKPIFIAQSEVENAAQDGRCSGFAGRDLLIKIG